jgi:hypothetical protein
MELLGELNEIIQNAPLQVDQRFYLHIPLFKVEHSKKLLNRYWMRFGMGPSR